MFHTSELLCPLTVCRFLFAINTISMVKNDALFSYIAPSNIFAWLLMPLRYCMPLKHFVWLNRTIIKLTHFPVLFCIYLYERLWLAPSMYEPTDLVEHPGRGRNRNISLADPANRTAMFSPNVRVRDESVAGYQKDRALEEVFLRMPDSATLRTQRRNERRKTQTAIRNWMDQHDEDGASPGHWPSVDSRAVPEWQRRLSVGWERPSNLRMVSDVRSVASDPADLISNVGASARRATRLSPNIATEAPDYKDHTDADGDDELVTNDEDEDDNGTNAGLSRKSGKMSITDAGDYFSTPLTTRFETMATSHESSGKSSGKGAPGTPRQGNHRRAMHSRTMSTNTILYNPEIADQAQSSSSISPIKSPPKTRSSGRNTGTDTPTNAGRSPRRGSPRRAVYMPSAKPRPILPPRGITESGGVSRSALMSLKPRTQQRGARRLSSVDLSIMSDHTNLPFAGEDPNAGLPGSFQTQMAMAMMKDNRLRAAGGIDGADRDRMGRLVLARMKTLEESFSEIIKEMRDLRNSSTAPPTRRNSSGEEQRGPVIEIAGRKKPRGGDMSPKKSVGKRPASRRSTKEAPKEGLAMTREKGKGKEVEYTTDDEADAESSFARKGSSL